MSQPISRRQFLVTSGVAGALFTGYALGFEPLHILVVRQIIRSEGASTDCRVRLVQLSDLHLGRIGNFEKLTAAKVRSLRPDFIVITGDICTNGTTLEMFDHFLTLMGDVAPVYGVPGNWEHKANIDLIGLDAVYRRHHGRLLINESLWIQHGVATIQLTGLDNCSGGYPAMKNALQMTGPAANHLILVHCPITRDMVAADIFKLSGTLSQIMLAGHTHGGQVTIFGFAPYVPPGSGSYTYGWYGGDGPRMFVSRGVGTTTIPVRFMAPPEIVCFEWFLRKEDTLQKKAGAK